LFGRHHVAELTHLTERSNRVHGPDTRQPRRSELTDASR